MPIHDWTMVKSGIWHNFHVLWTGTITNALNGGVLPPGYFAVAEQIIGSPEPDVIALRTDTNGHSGPQGGGVATKVPSPKARFVERLAQDRYTRKANQIAIRHELGAVVAVIELVSPGNKNNRHAIRAFVDKIADMLVQGVNLLIVDLFPPSVRDPQGIHRAIWNEFSENQFELPADKPLTVVSYETGLTTTAYVEPVAVGDMLPEMPLFLAPQWHVTVPLEATYKATWDALPSQLQNLVKSGWENKR